jgi:hypothetical protein
MGGAARLLIRVVGGVGDRVGGEPMCRDSRIRQEVSVGNGMFRNLVMRANLLKVRRCRWPERKPLRCTGVTQRYGKCARQADFGRHVATTCRVGDVMDRSANAQRRDGNVTSTRV